MKLFLSGLVLLNSVPALAQPKEKHLRAKDSIRAARQATSYEAKASAYRQIDENSVQDDDDVKEIYDELKNFPLEPREVKQAKQRLKTAQRLASVLGKSRKPSQHSIVRQLLELEEAELPINYLGPWGAGTDEDGVKEALRFGRYKALVEAAGAGKNSSALPVLRKLRKKGGEAGKSAEVAIGQIGKDEDLNEFIAEIKRDPKARIYLDGFGEKAVDRIVKDIEGGTGPEEEKIRLLAAMPTRVPTESMGKVRSLLKHPNPRIAEIAARRLRTSMGAGDEAGVRELLASTNRAVQDEALNAVGDHWDLKFLPQLLAVLKNDPAAYRRSIAANILGKNKVIEAEQALRDAAGSDADSNVRESATFALKRMGR